MHKLTLPEYLASGLYLLWLVLTIFFQFPKFRDFISKWDPFYLIPQWNFFAPNPLDMDLHILYKDELKDGSLTDWTEIPIIKKRNSFAFIWNPVKRQQKAFFDVTVELVTYGKANGSKTLHNTIPYLLFLNYVSNVKRRYDPITTQFMIMLLPPGTHKRVPQVLYVSPLHKL